MIKPLFLLVKSCSGFHLPSGDFAEFWSWPFFSDRFLSCSVIPATTTSCTICCSNPESLSVSHTYHALFHVSTHLPHHYLFALECPFQISLNPSSPSLFSVFYLSFKFWLKEKVTFHLSLPDISYSISVPFLCPRLCVHHIWHTHLLIALVILNCH